MMISAGLADPRMRIEIEVTARIGQGTRAKAGDAADGIPAAAGERPPVQDLFAAGEQPPVPSRAAGEQPLERPAG